MQLQIRKSDNRIIGYSSGGLIDGEDYYVEDCDIEIDDEKIYFCIYEGGVHVFYQSIKDEYEEEQLLIELRQRREHECFSVINRGNAWYLINVNTEDRQLELQEWYQSWLDVTETKVIPEKPEWIN